MAEREEWIRKRGGYSKISNILPQVTKPVFGKTNSIAGTVISEWPLIVGEEVASKTMPVKLTSSQNHRDSDKISVLNVDVFDSYAIEIQHLEPVILERIAAYLGHNNIKKLKFRQIAETTGISGKGNVGRSKSNKKFNCITDRDSIVSALDNISDADLREALEKLVLK